MEQTDEPYIPYQKIAPLLGLKPEDTVLFSSDITKLAKKAIARENAFDAYAWINSLKACLPGGTLLFPAFTDRLENGDTFDYHKSRPNTGSLSIKAFRSSDFKRTKDPFHSFLVWGKEQERLCSTFDSSTFGAQSVFSHLHQLKGKMITLDVPIINSFTFVHYVEEMMQVPYRTYKTYTLQYINNNGEKQIIKHKFFKRKLHVINWLDELEALFLKEGISEKICINRSVFLITDLAKAYKRIVEDIQCNKGQMLHKKDYRIFLLILTKKILKSAGVYNKPL